jgi:hypothetical protein
MTKARKPGVAVAAFRRRAVRGDSQAVLVAVAFGLQVCDSQVFDGVFAEFRGHQRLFQRRVVEFVCQNRTGRFGLEFGGIYRIPEQL